MKLKKIASLALAGVMAVSMLAGCSNGSNGGNANNDDGGNGGTVVPATSAVVNAVNNGQSAANDVKVEFTANSELDATLAKAVEVYGDDADDTYYNEVKAAITRLTGLKSKRADEGENSYTTPNWVGDANGFLTDEVDRAQAVQYNKDAKGNVYTWFDLMRVSALNEDAALNYIAWVLNQEIAGFAAHSDVNGDKAGDKYYGYSYDGNISMVSVEKLDGTTEYYVAFVINQTVSEQTLA